jgi:death on curing protein
VVVPLTYDEVLHIHHVLVDDFKDSSDPLQPPGVRDGGMLLRSAVDRQTVGFGDVLKYPSAVLNAASLCFGISNNHCFHNGNKRTALVALLCHLDKNGLTFEGTVLHAALYDLMIAVASHSLVKARGKHRVSSDEEVQALAGWIDDRTRPIKRGERVITYRQLRTVLKRHGIELENPQGNSIDVVRYETIQRGFLFRRSEMIKKRLMNIPYPRDGAVVGKNLIKGIRERCGLRNSDGYDSDAFYNATTSVDVFVAQYRGTLRRLAKV